MAKEWILNSAMNRFQLNFKRNVGATSEAIRKCSPKTLGEWREYYFTNVRNKSHIEDLGRKLYIKITEVIQAEVADITEQDCVDYMLTLVIERTFEGYMSEITTVYGQLEKLLNIKIEPAPDEWDRAFNVDFFIKISNKYIGLQIKPVSNTQLPQIFKERAIQEKTHKAFTAKYGGKVFYIYSIKRDGKKTIANPQVIPEIQEEISKLSQ